MKVSAPPEIRDSTEIGFLGAAFRARTELIVDLSNVRWLSPLGVVAVLSTALAAQDRELRITIDLPEDKAARTYLERIGFYSELKSRGWGIAGDLGLDPGFQISACLPVTPLTTERQVEDASNRLAEAMREVPVAPGVYERVMTVAVELTQNAREHGSPCYMVVQTHSGRTSQTPGVHVAVADFGKGFAESLKPVLGRLGDGEAMIRAFDERISGTGLPERGFGLGYVSEEIDGHRGAVLTLVSRTAALTRVATEFVVQTGRIDFRGTLATAYFPYHPPTNEGGGSDAPDIG